jgi:hypothetical protein
LFVEAQSLKVSSAMAGRVHHDVADWRFGQVVQVQGSSQTATIANENNWIIRLEEADWAHLKRGGFWPGVDVVYHKQHKERKENARIK